MMNIDNHNSWNAAELAARVFARKERKLIRNHPNADENYLTVDQILIISG